MLIKPFCLPVLLLLSIGFFAGCATLERARDAGFTVTQVAAGDFEIVTAHRGLTDAKTLVIYIEGDGRAWRTAARMSKNPTPRNPVALNLALADPSTTVLYIARPCQYLSKEQLAQCSPRYWSTYRYAEKVIAAVDSVIDWSLSKTSGQIGIGLVGYSGGGTVAALVAARRSDVDWLITVAGLLDHATWTQLEELTPLHHSLNPIDFAPALRGIPQLHLVGEKDDNISLAVARSYQQALGGPANVKVEVVPDYTHKCCWEDLWPAPLCRFSPPGNAACGAP